MAQLVAIEIDGIRFEFDGPVTDEEIDHLIGKYRKRVVERVVEKAPNVVVLPAVVTSPNTDWNPYWPPRIWC